MNIANQKYLLLGQQTERLEFRKFVPSDFDDWLPFHRDPRSSQFWSGLPEDPVEACTQQFERLFERYGKGLGGMNALIDKTNGKLVGMAGLLFQTVDGLNELEIGYSILPEYWRRGYATEAAIKCRNHAFGQHLTHSLISIIHIDNLPSQKVAINNGMLLDKTTTYKENPVHIFRIDK